MGWASDYIAHLQSGEAVQFRPRGNSMAGKIESGQLCTVEPVDAAAIKVGDIVLCKVNGKQYLHLMKAIVVLGIVCGTACLLFPFVLCRRLGIKAMMSRGAWA